MIKLRNPMVLQPLNHPHMPKNLISSKKKEQFIPYNKSIMTRIMAPVISKNNIIIMHHMTRRSIGAHLDKTTQNGSLFAFLDKIYGEKRLSKKKINE